MSSTKKKTLYHYCNLNTFLSIIKNSSIWLSDVQKSNDRRELAWFRQQYYKYISEKYKETSDKNIQTICTNILSIALEDDFKDVPSWLRLSTSETPKKLMNIFGSLRVYAFCLSEHSDSLGQWRGYADDGKGIAIGFSHDYLKSVSSNSLRCPYFNFCLGDISYTNEGNFSLLFDELFAMHDTSKTDLFTLNSMIDMIHTSALFKHPSFQEEREWRIICSMNDYSVTYDMLTFKDYDLVISEKFKTNFTIPKIDYIAKETDIISHIEIGIKNISAAINSIVLGPKCTATENDIRHILLRFGVIKTFDSQEIEIIRSESSYR